MKPKRMIPYTLCLLFIVGLVGCTKSEYIEIDVAPQLELTIINSAGLEQQGASIKLFNTEEDFYSNSNPVRNGSSDGNGVCLFKDLEESIYYFYIEKGDLNNYYEEVTFSTPLKINEIRTMQCTIR